MNEKIYRMDYINPKTKEIIFSHQGTAADLARLYCGINEIKISSYVTPQMASDIRDLANLKHVTIANFVVGVLDEYIQPKREKINTFRELQKEI